MPNTCQSCHRRLPALAFAYTDRSHTERRDVCRQCNRRAWEKVNNAQRRRERIAREFDGGATSLRFNRTFEWTPSKVDLAEQAECREACGMAW